MSHSYDSIDLGVPALLTYPHYYYSFCCFRVAKIVIVIDGCCLDTRTKDTCIVLLINPVSVNVTSVSNIEFHIEYS